MRKRRKYVVGYPNEDDSRGLSLWGGFFGRLTLEEARKCCQLRSSMIIYRLVLVKPKGKK